MVAHAADPVSSSAPAHHRVMGTQSRQPAGIRTGGQFMTEVRAESATTLVDVDDTDEDDDRCSQCGGDLSDGEGYDGLCGACADAAEAEGRWGDPDDDD